MNPYIIRKGETLSRDIADYPDGLVLIIDKPYRWTSADVIRKIKFAAFRHFRKKNLKVGHAGTLDPLASGVLLVCIGAATKRAEEFQRHDKEYESDFVLGATTASYDLEKEIDAHFPYEHITREACENLLPSFLGEQDQVAPLFSAKSIDGVRAYELARKAFQRGEPIDDSLLRAAKIRIHDLALLDFGSYCADGAEGADVGADAGSAGAVRAGAVHGASSRIHIADSRAANGLPFVRLRIGCSKGTYIRSLARDFGEGLQSGAFISRLKRTASGSFRIEDSLSIEDTLKLFHKDA
ncbi:MAG: tRNA pseudouridine(55) synthase TruB [Bacteroidales bacterium]|nr:tRNA pseudouridine(55) synthase TruB [Bacteroidales bacterium]